MPSRVKQALLFIYLTTVPFLLYSQKIDSLKVYSKVFDQERKILIYTPWEYDNKPGKKFEVIYVFDAQARRYFDNVHSTLGFLNRSQFPMIVVGIVSENRNKDLLPKNNHPETSKKYNGVTGEADKFLSFMGDELVPYIDSHYRTFPKRIAVGHSNGGTFITICLLKKPALFDAFIAISPNYQYDQEQLVGMIEKFDPSQLNSTKFIYMCNANEGSEWVSSKKKAIALFKSKPFKDKVILTDEDFSATCDHTTVYPIGLISGLKKYLDYQFFNVKNFIAYYTDLYNNKHIDLSPEVLKNISRTYLMNGEFEDAAKIVAWAIQLFPNEISLYNHAAEMHQSQNKNQEAIKYYRLFKEKLDLNKELSKAELDALKSNIDARIKTLESQE